MNKVDLKLDGVFSGSNISITVCVPVYNVQDYLRDCLDSLFQQDYSFFDVLMIDDGSTDDSGSICDEYVAKYPERSLVVHKNNEGPLLARREGFSRATGEYVMCVDSDDMLFPGALSVVAYAVAHTGADIVHFGHTRNIDEIRPISVADGNNDLLLSSKKKVDQLSLICRSTDGSQNPMCFKAIRRECVDANRDYSSFVGLTFCEDFLQTLAAYDLAKTFCELNKKIYFYRPGSGITKAYSPHFYFDVCRCLNEGERFASQWEQEYSCKGLMSGLASCRLDSAACYAEWLVSVGDKKGLKTLRDSLDLNRCFESADYSLLRIDRRMVLFALRHHITILISLISVIRDLKKSLV